MTTPYRDRDELEATEVEHQRLEAELGDLRARDAALQVDKVGLEGELAAVRRKLDALRSRRTLPLLENIRIAAPCNVEWDSMQGDDKTRFCGECKKNVHNLSAMTREEAESFVREQTNEACIRLYRRADDTVLTADCPVGLRRRRVRKLVVAGIGGGLVAAAAAVALTPRPMQGSLALHPGHPSAVAIPSASALPAPSASGPPPHSDGGHYVMGRNPVRAPVKRASALPNRSP
jgi:hypothetical protein